jgi:predicted nuclease of predicted toxin-antitoxin system
MRFVVDAQLPPALARYLSSLGHDAEHVFDLDMKIFQFRLR